MKINIKTTFRSIAVLGVLGVFFDSTRADEIFYAENYLEKNSEYLADVDNTAALISIPVDSTEDDTLDLIYPFKDNSGDPFTNDKSPLYLKDPNNIKSGFEYDPETGQYNYYERIGEKYYRSPTYMSLEDYANYDADKRMKEYWRSKSEAETLERSTGFRPQLQVKGELFDRIFGGNTIDIRPQGSAELSFGVNISRRDNPILPERQRRTTNFDFNQKIQLNVIGNIGEKLKLQTSYNTEATFDFENQMKLEYTGYEDEIIQKIEAGNVSLPLQSTLIQGSQTLFGVKTELQFGRLRVTSIFSQEKGERKQIAVKGGAQVQTFEKSALKYEENKHFFLAHFFREAYEQALAEPPRVNSRIQITDVEIYVTNNQGAYTNTKNIIAFHDLAEHNRINNTNLVSPIPDTIVPSNYANNLYKNLNGNGTFTNTSQIRNFNNADQALAANGLRTGEDYERLQNAVLLNPSEYTINKDLGYVSLNRTLNPQDILAVSYRYTYNGKVYQVGDLSTDGIDGQDALFLKLLKGTIINTQIPMWDLMMKNVYSLDAFNVNAENFRFEVWYLNSETAVEIPYIPAGEIDKTPLLNVLKLDRLTINNTQTPKGDGVFDFLPGITINEKNGRVYFPVLEPFGSFLRSQFSDSQLADKYAFDSLYSTTQALAEQDAKHNRFTFKGSYQSSSSSEISLNTFNIPQGSVTVTAGGAPLVENQDYQVDYNLGRVTILNKGILESGTPINISLGSNSLFNVQTKTLLGSRFDYRLSKDISLGGTVLNLTERPITRKINIGDEPISNTVVGLDGTFRSEVPLLTTLADKLPFYDTKEKSVFTLQAEAARLFPGNSKAISKAGVAYIDDFEGSQSIIEIRNAISWKLASTPQGQEDLFPEGELNGDLAYGFNRAHLSWYTIDPLFFRNDNRTPANIKNSKSQSNNFSREVLETEVFPNKDPEPGLINNISTLDLAFYPKERGPFNYDANGRPGISSGLNADGTLKNPESRWGGIMRDIQTSDFEATNVEFIQFWIMDPFNAQDGNPNQDGGEMYFNIGSISEDILKDGRLMFENGLPDDGGTANTSTVIWGRVPTASYVIKAFDNTLEARTNQDVGLDGVNNARERTAFTNYLNQLQSILDANAFNDFNADPSNDDYHYYRGSDYDNEGLTILQRYKRYNGTEGNSPVETGNSAFSTSASTLPDNEDINGNFSLDRTEAYYQYKVDLSPQALQPGNVGTNYITDVLQGTSKVNGELKQVNWYQFKIPIREPEKVIGNIRDFKSIRFMRVFLKGFDEEVIVRFARLGLVRGEWRKYTNDQLIPGDSHSDEDGSTTFNISAVNVEENSNRRPINYVIPPDIQREVDFGTTNLRQINEQSLVLNVCNLNDGYTRSAYRNLDLDIRQYKKIKMYAHAEAAGDENALKNNDIAVVLRLGTDFEENYYEYEVPLIVTPYGTSSSNDRAIWPEANNIDLQFEKLLQAKKNRNALLLNPGSGVSITKPYLEADGDRNVIRIKGNPNLAEVRVVMIGVKNLRTGETSFNDDGLPKCAEVWVNELRLSDFDNEGGWAATARATAQIADLGAVTLSGSMSTPGWGSLEQKLNERQRETRMAYDLSTSVELGKLLPEKARISIPMYFGVSENIIRPEYNPLDPDLQLNDIIKDDDFTKDYRDSIRRITDDYTKTKSINFTNVRKERAPTKTKMMPYDIENFAFTYAYTETFKRDINTKYDNRKTYKGAINYNYTAKPLTIEPFKNVEFFKKRKAFTLIKDFNFNLYPTQYSFQTAVNRTYNERQIRNNTSFFEFQPFYQKTFNWSRVYSLRYNITQSLIMDYSANNLAQIGEPEGRVDKDYKEEYQNFKDSVITNFLNLGSNTQFNQNLNLTYALPFSKIPYFEWISANATYKGTYGWNLNGSIDAAADSLGATIKNSGNYGINANLNMMSLYNKVDYLKELNQPKKKEREVKGLTLADKTYRKKVEAGEIEDTTKDDEPSFFRIHILDNLSRLAMSLRTVNASYSVTEGTILPHYNRDMSVLGFDPNFNAPGVGFVFGLQEPGTQFFDRALEEGWVLQSRNGLFISGNFTKTYSENLNLRASFQPVRDLRIELNGNRTYTENTSQYYIWNDSIGGSGRGGYEFGPTQINGSYSVSFIGIKTAFVKDNEDTYQNETFDNFLSYRSIISQRLGAEDPNSTFTYLDTNGGIYSDGYGSTSQRVLINSFLAAYSGADASTTSLGDFTSRLPVPNWSITYDGLSKLDFFKKYFRSFTIGHRYRSTFNVGSFSTNPFFEDDLPNARLNSGDFITQRQVSSVSISEQFSPLINVDMTWNNSILTKLEYKKDRAMNLSLNNNQLTEVKGHEMVIGLGYRLKNVPFPIKFGNGKKVSDIDFRADFSIRNNRTIIRKIVERQNELTAGQRVYSIKITADYVMSSRLNVRAFYDRIVNNPFISSTFPTANTSAGISLRFTLSQ